MPEKIKDLQPPSGLARLAFRAPLWLYRLGLGRLLGKRFLQLSHIGRKSGLLRQTVLEVVRYDRAENTYIIAAGFGARSDWYQNILVNPQVEVQSGGDRLPAVAAPLSPEQTGEELVGYARAHPMAFKELLRFMGFRVDGSEADTRALGEYLQLFALRPREG